MEGAVNQVLLDVAKTDGKAAYRDFNITEPLEEVENGSLKPSGVLHFIPSRLR